MLPKGRFSACCRRARSSRAPATSFYLQLIEPIPDRTSLGGGPGPRRPRRRDVPAAVRALTGRHRVRRSRRAAQRQGRATQFYLGNVTFELVVSPDDIDHFGMDTITLAGPLEAAPRHPRGRLHQAMLNAGDLVGHPVGKMPLRVVRESGLRSPASGIAGLRGALRSPHRTSSIGKRCWRCASARLDRAAGVLVDLAHATGDKIRSSADLRKLAPGGSVGIASPTRRSPGRHVVY